MRVRFLAAVAFSVVALGAGSLYLAKNHSNWFSHPSRKLASNPNVEKDALSDFLALTGGEMPSPDDLLAFIKTRALGPLPPLRIGQEELGVFGFAVNLIPKGRSPEAPFTDFTSPRSLIAFPVRPEGRFLYLGYSPRQDLMQIISEDQGASPRMRFSEIQGYGRPGAVLSRDVEQRCVSCHMYRRLVFPTAGWRETLENPRIFGAVRAVRANLDGLARSILDEESERQRDFASTQNFNSSGFVFQLATDIGLRRVQNYSICSNICRGDIKCLRDLVLVQIEADLGRFDSRRPFIRRLGQRVLRLYRETPIDRDFGSISWTGRRALLTLNLPSRAIQDRDPLDTNGNLVEYREGDRGMQINPSPGDAPEDLSPRLDAKASEPKMLLLNDLSSMSADCVPLTADQMASLSPRSQAELEQRAMSTELRELLNSWPASGPAIGAFMADSTVVHPLPDSSPQWERTANITAVVSSRRAPLETFRAVCGQCHQSQSRREAMYLPFESLSRMKTFRGVRTGRASLDFLQQRLMPPPGSDVILSDEDRAAAIRVLTEH